MEDLKADIHRYPSNASRALIQTLQEQMEKEEAEFLYVIQLVKNNQLLGLQNRRVKTLEELDMVGKELQEIACQYDEIWYNKTKMKENQNESGRFAVDLITKKQYLEQIWGRSPREINTMTQQEGVFLDEEKKHICTMTATRNFWGNVWSVQTANISKEDIQEGDYTLSFAKTIGQIEGNRKKIEEFEEFLEGIGIHAYSLEYKCSDGKFHFIDFDTENDKKVINEIEKMRLLEERE